MHVTKMTVAALALAFSTTLTFAQTGTGTGAPGGRMDKGGSSMEQNDSRTNGGMSRDQGMRDGATTGMGSGGMNGSSSGQSNVAPGTNTNNGGMTSGSTNSGAR